LEQLRSSTKPQLWIPILTSVMMFGFHLIYEYYDTRLGMTGVYPRNSHGIAGIFFSPMMHSDWRHLFSNIFPYFGLSLLLFYLYRKISVYGLALIYVLTGFVVWLFARPVYHIGASGVVYGLVSFVFCNGIFRRHPVSIILSLIVTFVYLGSGYFLGILPNQKGISWESHLFGALVGVFVSFVLKDVSEDSEVFRKPLPDETKEPFLPRDIFDRKKWERGNDSDFEA